MQEFLEALRGAAADGEAQVTLTLTLTLGFKQHQ